MALTSGLISYYKLDGNSTDAVSSNNGTDTNTTYSTGNGKIGQGAGLNGTNSQISLGDPSNLHNANFTVSFWMKSSSASGYQTPIVKGYTAAPWTNPYVTFLMRLNWPTNFIEVGLSNGSTYTSNTWSSSPISTTGVWYHMAFTYNGTTGTLYINGSSQGSFSYGTTLAYSSQPWLIGSDQSGSPSIEYFAGAIDEVGIWNRAITSTEVTQLYNSGNGLAYPFGNNASFLLKMI